MTGVLLLLFMTLCGALGALFFKRATADMKGVFSLLRLPFFYLGGSFYLAGALLNILLLRNMDYSVVYPMTALTYVWSLALSRLLLGERVTRSKFMGVGAILLGLCLLV